MSNRKMKVVKGKVPRQNLRKRQNTAGSSDATVLNVLHKLIPSYPRQICWDVILPGTMTKSTTTVTTGAIATTYSINIGAIGSFATRFGSTFIEYRIVSALVKMKMFSSTNPGTVQFWYDEKSAAAPTTVEALERYIVSMSASQVDKPASLMWKAVDLIDLGYSAIGVTTTPVTFKALTNNANFGSSIVATDYFELSSTLRVQFRGLVGV